MLKIAKRAQLCFDLSQILAAAAPEILRSHQLVEQRRGNFAWNRLGDMRYPSFEKSCLPKPCR
jgi:hypothetical protein